MNFSPLQRSALQSAVEIIYFALKQYRVSGELVINDVYDPLEQKYPRWITTILRKINKNSGVIFITPTGWNRSLEYQRSNDISGLKVGNVISAEWAPLVGELIHYRVIDSVSPAMIPPLLTPDWKKLDRETYGKSAFYMFVAASSVWGIFLFDFIFTQNMESSLSGILIGGLVTGMFGLSWLFHSS